MKKDLIIDLLKIGEAYSEEGVTYTEIFIFLTKNKKHEISEHRLKILMFKLYESLDDSVYFNTPNSIPNDCKSGLTIESKFRLLEYVELQDARSSSRNALWMAFAAMIISGVLAGTSIWFEASSTALDEVKSASEETNDRLKSIATRIPRR